jgi:two-component system, chemotaxis family, CheB/CheR fusion protein
MKRTKKTVSNDATEIEKDSVHPDSPENIKTNFPIIGIGASAGGLEAFELFFKNMPSKSGMAFVLVSHLEPSHVSLLSEILQRNTTMPVHEVKDGMLIQVNNVYTIPPNKDLTIFQGRLLLSPAAKERGVRLPIDSFFRSLAEEQGERAIGIILSGAGSDGTVGLRDIIGAGGVTFVQQPTTAKYDSMPLSAIQNELATYVLPVEKITEQLVAYVKKLAISGASQISKEQSAPEGMRRIEMLLRVKTGNDFSQYKQSTIKRRIERRMAVHNLNSMESYARFLQENPSEVRSLFQEMLINVTSFFRDKEAFDAVRKTVLPQMFANKPENYLYRVWVPGCSSGEEAYSLAMLFQEYMGDNKLALRLQIYATDIDENSITTARGGVYPSDIAIDVSPERLERFFIKEGNKFRVKREIREMIVFAVQNAIKDPPFTKMDMISCRNLLIYLESETQSRLIPMFHYALKPDGVLFLSPSEGIGNFSDLFEPIDRKMKIYRAKSSTLSAQTQMVRRLSAFDKQSESEGGRDLICKEKTNVSELTKRLLLQSFAPPSVITDIEGNIEYVHGDTGDYLQPAQGYASLNVIEMAREGLQIGLRNAINKAAANDRSAVSEGQLERANGDFGNIEIKVQHLKNPDDPRVLLLISFLKIEQKKPSRSKHAKRTLSGNSSKRLEELERELSYMKENLQANAEEMQAANEELKSTNEELQSTNEELQSTNEEMETSKEELQSVNEEIVTVNSEMQDKIEQLTAVQNDMRNLLEVVNIGMIFLDDRLVISRFTHDAARVYRLVDKDIGRPLADIRSLIIDVDLIHDAQEILNTLIPRERTVLTTSNEWFHVRMIPYRTLENVIAGVVMTFSDITALKEKETEAIAARDYAQSIVDTVREPLVVLNEKFEIVSASKSFYRNFEETPEGIEGRSLYRLGNRQWDTPAIHELLEVVLPKGEIFEDVELEQEIPSIGNRVLRMNARKIASIAGSKKLILLAMEDVTDRREIMEKI